MDDILKFVILGLIFAIFLYGINIDGKHYNATCNQINGIGFEYVNSK